MKILHIVPSYIPAHRYGGPIESVHSLNVGLAKAGAEVTVYTTNIDGPNDLNAPTGVPVMVDGVKVFYFKSSFPRAWFYSRDLHKALAKNSGQFDLIHITSVFLSASTLGAYYAKKFKKPYIISPRGNLMLSPLGKKNFKKSIYNWLIEKRNLRGAAAIHFTVPTEEEEYIKGKFPMKKSIVLPNIVKLEKIAENFPSGYFRKKFNISDDKKIVIYLGRLSWIKGFDTLVPAFKTVVKKHPEAILVIAGGDDGFKKTINELIGRYQLDKSVLFAGMLAGGEKIAALQDSNIFVMPSYSESFGMSVVEAMSVGKPVVVTKGVGISSYIVSAKAGIVVEKNEAELSEAIISLLENAGMGKKMGENGKILVEGEFSEDKISKKFLEEYQSIINEKK
ncbi:MAG: glycosyltransferase [bacterium]|nr:glycosyltransferase [bacterium]